MTVFLRIKPSNDPNADSIPVDITEKAITLNQPDSKMSQKYKFTGVFKKDTHNEKLCNTGLASVIEDLDKGLNVTLMVYGITGSGKTFTIFGKEGELHQPEDTLRSSEFDSVGSFRDRYAKETIELQ